MKIYKEEKKILMIRKTWEIVMTGWQWIVFFQEHQEESRLTALPVRQVSLCAMVKSRWSYSLSFLPKLFQTSKKLEEWIKKIWGQ